MTKRRRFQSLLAIGALVAIDVGSWLVLGEQCLRRDLPTMAGIDLELCGGQAPYGLKLRDIVMLEQGRGALQAVTKQELRAAFARYGFALRSEAELVAEGRLTDAGCSECLGFAYRVRFNTPVLADVDTHQFLYSGGSSVFRHRRVWLFGAWLKVSDDLAGQE
jgi:hypothetical protein